MVCWGTPEYGGDSSSVQSQLKRVSDIQSTNHAFGALLEDGSVVTWGHAFYGGILSVTGICTLFWSLNMLTLLKDYYMDY